MKLAPKTNAALAALLAALFLGTPGSFGVAQATSAPAGARICARPNDAVREYAGVIEKTRKEQPELAEALRLFPKGGDLHNHLSGTVPAETYLALAAADGACFGPEGKTGRYTLEGGTSSGGCGDGFSPVSGASPAEREGILQSLSMYRLGYADTQQGHDHFFATFARFRAVSDNVCNTPPMLAEVLRRSHRDGVSYLETMLSFQSSAVNALARQLRQRFPLEASYRDSRQFPAMQRFLLDAGLKDAVAAARTEIAQYVNKTRTLLNCGTPEADGACGVSYAFVSTVNRTSAQGDGTPDLAKVFTQAAFSMQLSSSEPRVVGVNLLSKEDAPVSLTGFQDQMRIFRYFHDAFPGVNIALHAGELTPCFVGGDNPALKEHLTGTLKAGARRIGHGVSFAFLKPEEKSEVAEQIRRNNALVEIMFTSNAQILGVAGAEHPFAQYRVYGVPVAFASDDEGVSHANLTDEWIYGFEKYALTRDDLQYLGRNSLQYSFIPGAPLWADVAQGKPVEACSGDAPGSATPSPRCASFLKQSAKGAAQWEYEARLKEYWHNYGKYFEKR
ncbi:hypothetical protein KOM00_19535 [Geomonas sp. Red69]|uniref:adenosine deaminase n=1 Tax=Geomonas diazotrophica TaxID=2843197 RepID=A0ABX8JDC1_9BACT|nr:MULTISPECIES: hypothetical protein [Geomonas]MBU5638918.1 hypothetical protein [Geomonas diazotrophica]QWV96398.1 hypothetical protein KP005_13575 [Geomonas nitrogeniifigens]QXE85465.1 hypothetical protein KP003_13860 [Geomonas nitrogeniifigens]